VRLFAACNWLGRILFVGDRPFQGQSAGDAAYKINGSSGAMIVSKHWPGSGIPKSAISQTC